MVRGEQAGAGGGAAPPPLGLDPLGGPGAGDQGRPGHSAQVGEGGQVWSKAVDSSFNVQVSYIRFLMKCVLWFLLQPVTVQFRIFLPFPRYPQNYEVL